VTELTVVGRAHRRYSKRTKANAAGIAMAEGVTEAERQTGIPKETIHYWLRQPEFAHLRTTARETVAEDFWAGVQIGIDEVTKGLRDPNVPLKDKAIALGTIYDRFALLTGSATSRTEHRELLADFDDHERDAMAEWLRELARERLDADPAPA
jgi:hypothetical protein